LSAGAQAIPQAVQGSAILQVILLPAAFSF
jgi:hypothetical protein